MATIFGHIDQLEMDMRSLRLHYRRGDTTIPEALSALDDITNSLKVVQKQNEAVYRLVMASESLHHTNELDEASARIIAIAKDISLLASQVGSDISVLKFTKSQASA